VITGAREGMVSYSPSALSGQKLAKVVGVRGIQVGKFLQQLSSLLVWRLRPFRKCFLGGVDTVFNVICGSDRDRPQRGSIKGIYAFLGRYGTARLAINYVVKGIEIHGRRMFLQDLYGSERFNEDRMTK
jgi:hypothetical protein